MFILGTTETILWGCQVAVNIPILQELVDAGANFSRATFPANVLDRFFILRIVTQFVPVINKLVKRYPIQLSELTVFSLVTDLLFVEPLFPLD